LAATSWNQLSGRAWTALALAAALGCAAEPGVRTVEPDPREVHFSTLRMLTDGGENAEAYFSFEGKRLIFQSTRPPYACDQIFTMDLEGRDVTLVSTGLGRTTCAYFLPGDERIVYASTHLGGQECPTPPDRSQGYVWPLDRHYDLFVARADGSDPQRLTATPGYDAEATVSPQGDRLVFTSLRDGDLELYSMKLDGSDVRRLTHALGYDGGAFYSPDGSKIVYRAHRPTDPQEIEDYQSLLARGLVRPTRLEIWVMDADGANAHQVTNLGAAAFAPFFHPSGEQILFSSNHHDPKRREFDLFSVHLDGSGLEQVTFAEGFDGFPMFSPDGRWLAFASNRHNRRPHETNVFVTRWVE
jgi:Tol biopolymer transport system component